MVTYRAKNVSMAIKKPAFYYPTVILITGQHLEYFRRQIEHRSLTREVSTRIEPAGMLWMCW
jgi:hypothetical protein